MIREQPGKAAPSPGQSAPEAAGESTPRALRDERKLATILFADMSGFTALAETMDPEAVRDLLNGCFERLVPVIEKYEGTIEKYIGDEIMAIFGAPVMHEDDAERALHAALEMRVTASRFNADQGTDLSLHFGVNTGLVIAGGIGARGRQEYAVTGDTVNVAARLEKAAPRGEIFVGEATHRLTCARFEFETLEPIRAKGKTAPVAVYRLLKPKAQPGRARDTADVEPAQGRRESDSSVDGGERVPPGGRGMVPPAGDLSQRRLPLAGRQAELAILEAALARLREGVGSIITVSGEAGLGKSRLVTELRQRSRVQVGTRLGPGHGLEPLWVEAHGLSYGGDVAYYLWRELLCGMLGSSPSAGQEALEAMLREQVQQTCPDQLELVHPFLHAILIPPGAGSSNSRNDPPSETIRPRTFHAILTFFEAAARRQPIILVCEDLHWVDPSSLECLEQALGLPDRTPVLLLCTLRPETGHGCWRIKETAGRDFHHLHSDITLRPLPRDECRALLRSLATDRPPGAKLENQLLDLTEGNPLYLEQLAHSLIDGGVQGALRSDVDTALRLPETLQGVLLSRIDRLDHAAKRLLQMAAVLGRVFPEQLLRALASGEDLDVENGLRALRRAGMVREKSRLPETEYMFCHHLMQEAAYHSLLKKDRQAFHRLAALELEPMLSSRKELLEIQAHHWEQAQEWPKACPLLRMAGDHAASVYANEEAAAYYRRALSALGRLTSLAAHPSPGFAAETREHLGDALERMARHSEARELFREALRDHPAPALPDADPATDRARLERKIGSTYAHEYRWEEAHRAFDQAGQSLGKPSPEGSPERWQEWISIQLDRAWALYSQADWHRLETVIEELRPIVQTRGSTTQQAVFISTVPLMLLRRDRYVISDETMDCALTGRQNSLQSGSLPDQAYTGFLLAFCRLLRGELKLAEPELHTALSLAERVGDVILRTRCLTYFTVLWRKRGCPDQAAVWAQRSLQAAMDLRMPEYIAAANAHLAWTAWRQGDWARAESLAEAALATWKGSSVMMYPFRWAALWPLMGLARRQGDTDRIVDLARQLLDPTQQRLSPELEQKLTQLLEAQTSEERKKLPGIVAASFELAEAEGYL